MSESAAGPPDLSPEDERKAAWGYPTARQPRWQASLAVLLSIGLYVALPDRIIAGLGPRFLIPTLEGVLELSLFIASPWQITRESRRVRFLAIGLIAIINIANVVSLGELVHALLATSPPGGVNNGRQLVEASVPLWLTNVIVFALWYWELDRGGPVARLEDEHREPDFLFPQMSTPAAARPRWSPSFFDYLYTSFTNATAFSPTDTMPLTNWAKFLMMIQSFASLLTVALVVSRAVNILG